MPAVAPDAALIKWASSLPAVRCVAPAIRPWTHVPDSALVHITKTTHYQGSIGGGAPSLGLTLVAQGPQGFNYWIGTVPSRHAVVIHSGSEPDEESFTAVIGDATPPPRTVASVAAARKAPGNVGLGSTRAQVERVFGPARLESHCGYDVVRYEPAQPALSEAELWFIYRAGTVVAWTFYEAV